MTKSAEAIAFGCKYHATTATVWTTASQKTAHNVETRKQNQKPVQITEKSNNESAQRKVRAGKLIEEEYLTIAEN